MNYCQDCDNVAEQANHPGSHTPTWNWRCLKVPLDWGEQYLTRSRWPADGAPYMKCRDVRKIAAHSSGDDFIECSMFTPLRQQPQPQGK